VARYCTRPVLVGVSRWLPTDSFEFSWHSRVGCNQLVCLLCRERVRWQTHDTTRRRYDCGCYISYESDFHPIWTLPGDVPSLTRWRCDGHPELTLPAELDGVRLSGATEWVRLARDAMLDPPFVPPGLDLPAIWLTRLDALSADESLQHLLAAAIAQLLDSAEPALAAGASQFFLRTPVAMQLLLFTDGPASTGESLILARRLSLGGVEPEHFRTLFQDHDISWLLANAANLVRALPAWLQPLVDSSGLLGAARQAVAFSELAAVDTVPRQRLQAVIERGIDEPDRAAALAMVAAVRAGTHDCDEPIELVGGDRWLPIEPFEHQWSSGVGCNRLACQRCGHRVRSQLVLRQPSQRRYECGCQSTTIIGVAYVDSVTQPHHRPEIMDWACTGHPDLDFPTVLDGVTLAKTVDWAAISKLAILRPPFRPPGVELPSVWLLRLYRLLQDERDQRLLGGAVARHLNSTDPLLVRGALDLYFHEPLAWGAEEVSQLIARRKGWLRATRDPAYPTRTLRQSAKLVIERLPEWSRRPQPRAPQRTTETHPG
jgi:hypothetical protein